MNPLANLSARVIAMIGAAVLLIVLLGLAVHSCDKRRSKAAQARVERSQAEAASNSAADAVSTVARSGEATAASEDLTRSNDREIHGAEGAGQQVGVGVDAAGRAALCRREAYRNDPRCRGAAK